MTLGSVIDQECCKEGMQTEFKRALRLAQKGS